MGLLKIHKAVLTAAAVNNKRKTNGNWNKKMLGYSGRIVGAFWTT